MWKQKTACSQRETFFFFFRPRTYWCFSCDLCLAHFYITTERYCLPFNGDTPWLSKHFKVNENTLIARARFSKRMNGFRKVGYEATETHRKLFVLCKFLHAHFFVEHNTNIRALSLHLVSVLVVSPTFSIAHAF